MRRLRNKDRFCMMAVAGAGAVKGPGPRSGQSWMVLTGCLTFNMGSGRELLRCYVALASILVIVRSFSIAEGPQSVLLDPYIYPVPFIFEPSTYDSHSLYSSGAERSYHVSLSSFVLRKLIWYILVRWIVSRSCRLLHRLCRNRLLPRRRVQRMYPQNTLRAYSGFVGRKN